MRRHSFKNFINRAKTRPLSIKLITLKYIAESALLFPDIEKRFKLMCQVGLLLSYVNFKGRGRLTPCINTGRTRAVYCSAVSRHQFRVVQAQGLLIGWKKK